MLFYRELRRNLKSFIVTSLICSALVIYLISIANSFGNDIKQILDIKLPKQFQTAMGLQDLNFSRPNSFFALSFSYIYLFVSIYISSVFAVVVSKEFSDKTAEYLFSLPEKRVNIIYTKLFVAFLYALLTVVIIFIASWITFVIKIKDNYDLAPIVLMSLAWLIGGVTFGSIAFFLSSYLSKTSTVSTISIGFVFFMYMLQVVISVNDKIDYLKYISPFDWYKGSEITNTGELSLTYSLIALIVISASLYFGIRRFKKMDVLI